ncbi:YqaJ viral recombinase [Faustovirus]|nr:glutaredoxin-C2 [Faustovirus]QJX71826.1 glutaredoxin-C2 [Faustovirus]QJX72313.1 YqaJ viral recombinase [Faustovirus]QJX72823.1 proliferating cell nuclear antigen [Faustovirus]QJX73329.1 YqaJ viral recombinase [Faustovirus]
MNEKIITDFTNAHKIVVFSASYCPWCRRAKDLLNARGAKYVVVELDDPRNADIKPVLASMTDRKTIPNIFIDAINIGGYDDLVKHYE